MRIKAIAKLLTFMAGLLVPLLSPMVLADEMRSSKAVPEVKVVFIHARTCSVCAKVRPIIDDLEKQYKLRVRFIRLDVTGDKEKEDSRKLAKTLQLSSFFAFYEDTYPCVGVFNKRGKCLKELYGFNGKDKYITQIEKALSAR